jgi:CubicO group peptidase (beta-lactamase class C family)
MQKLNACKYPMSARSAILKDRPIAHTIKLLALLGILAVVLAACSSAPPNILPATLSPFTQTAGAYWPTQGWRTASAEEQGMDSSRLAAMLEWVQQEHLNLHSLLVIRHGYIVSETYFGGYHQNDPHQLYSCTKSFIATLIGIALDQGKIQDTSQTVLDFFPEKTFANLDAQKQAMTLEDLLTMRSGLNWQDVDPTFAAMVRSPDWVKYVLDKPMTQAPGSQFNYCSGCSHVLSAILQQASGGSTLNFAKQNLFEPLGITKVNWESDRTGIPNGGWGLHITPRDMAKLGYLYLHDGEWDGRQIVPAAWVQTATQKHTETDGELGYGYQWWVYPSYGAYSALGLEGQTIFVLPRSDVIVVTTAEMDGHDRIFQLIEEFVLPSITDD